MKKFAAILLSLALLAQTVVFSAFAAEKEYDGFFINMKFSDFGKEMGALNIEPSKSAIVPWFFYTGHGNQPNGIKYDENKELYFYATIRGTFGKSSRKHFLQIDKNGLPDVEYPAMKMAEIDFKFTGLSGKTKVTLWSDLIYAQLDENGVPALFLSDYNGRPVRVAALADDTRTRLKVQYRATAASDRYVYRIWLDGEPVVDYGEAGQRLYVHGGYPVEFTYAASGRWQICGITNIEDEILAQDAAIYVYGISYYGLGNVGVLSTSVDGGDEAISFPTDGKLMMRFNNPMDVQTLTPETVRLIDDAGENVEYTSYEADERSYAIDLSASPLDGNRKYTLRVSREIANILGETAAADTERDFYTASKTCAEITNVDISGGAAAVTVRNLDTAAHTVTVSGTGYREVNGGRQAQELGVQTKTVAPGVSEVFSIPAADVGNFAKFFIWENGMNILGGSVRWENGGMTAGDETVAESVPQAGTGVTIAEPAVDVDTGLVSVSGYYHDLPKRPAAVVVKTPDGAKQLYADQFITDGNGAFAFDFVVPQGAAAGNYQLLVQAGAMTAPQEGTLALDFSAAKPAVTQPELAGTAFVGEEITAKYVYTHMGAVAEGASAFAWESSDSSDSGFAPIAGEAAKSITLGEEYAYRYLRYTISPVTEQGSVGAAVTSPAFRVFARPEVSGVSVGLENGALIADYSYSHLKGYDEKGHLFQWLRSSSASGEFSEISGANSARYTPASGDDGKYFIVEITPGADVPEGEEEARYGKTVRSTAYQYNGNSGSGGGSGSGGKKNTGSGSGSRGGSTAAVGPLTPNHPAEEQPGGFSDVKTHWARADIDYLRGLGMVSGVTETAFEPERAVTRAEFVKMLTGMLGLAPAKYAGAFSDVDAADWFAGAVQTALENGLAAGSDGRFLPDKTISREEMAKMLVSAYELRFGEIAAEQAGFTDRDSFSGWAAAYIEKAAAAGLMSGTGNGEFSAKEQATRAQAATVIARFHKNMAKGGVSK